MSGLEALISRRAEAAGRTVPAAALQPLAAYLALLGKWNRKINLTALSVDPPDEEAVDRLIIEPLVAWRWIESADRVLLDVGSGGGSPGLPLKILAPELELILVESKVRKASFLREAVRQLGLVDAMVENSRLEDSARRAGFAGRVDVLTLRGVRVDEGLLEAAVPFLSGRGRVFYFGGPSAVASLVEGFGLRVTGSEQLPGALGGLTVCGR